MERRKCYSTKKVVFLATIFLICFMILMGRLVYLMVFQSAYYSEYALQVEERERDIKAARGKLIDRNGKILATNRSVCTISVIHSQIKEPEQVISMLTKELGISAEQATKRVMKRSSIERVKTNVPKETGDKIRSYGLAGVKIDEDYKRYYPFEELASKVLGFTGGDNQGIIGLESYYDSYLAGVNGKILTLTDARGVEITNAAESRMEPVSGNDIYLSLDYNIQSYAQQLAEVAMLEHGASGVEILVMNPQNGQILAMANVPEFNLNEPFVVNGSPQTDMNILNQIWRNPCVSDTYEPGSSFKIITTAAAFEAQVVTLEDRFSCGGAITVEGTRIRCHKTTGHGAETFVDGIKNSCNPVFIQLGLRIGANRFYDYFQHFGLLNKTGVDLPGEARTIMHKKENIGQVELATMAFGQSFQITPMQLAATVSSLINGGYRITPHVAIQVRSADGALIKQLEDSQDQQIIRDETSKTLQSLLEQVVSDGTGKNAQVPGYAVGGKTATSQTLPRGSGKYIASFVGFAPADQPQVLALVIIHEPKGIYYGGTIAAPVAGKLFSNILLYLGITKTKEVEESHDGATLQNE